jgi:hypothetical protein
MLWFCMLGSAVVLLFAFCASAPKSATQRARSAKAANAATAIRLALSFLSTVFSPPV